MCWQCCVPCVLDPRSGLRGHENRLRVLKLKLEWEKFSHTGTLGSFSQWYPHKSWEILLAEVEKRRVLQLSNSVLMSQNRTYPKLI